VLMPTRLSPTLPWPCVPPVVDGYANFLAPWGLPSTVPVSTAPTRVVKKILPRLLAPKRAVRKRARQINHLAHPQLAQRQVN